MTLTQDEIDTLVLHPGAHASDSGKYCVMEAVAALAGEPWTDAPQCAGPVLGAFFRSWNDSLPNEDRQRLLKPFLLRLVGAAGSPEIEERRSWMALDWSVRNCLPAWLDLTPALASHALRLRAGVPITNATFLHEARPFIAATRAAARAATRAAAWAAADHALAPTVAALQASASDLATRMINAKDETT